MSDENHPPSEQSGEGDPSVSPPPPEQAVPSAYEPPTYQPPAYETPAEQTQPQAGYEQPQAGYEQPQAGYEQPQAGYEQPQAGYGQPQPGYGQPAYAPYQYTTPIPPLPKTPAMGTPSEGSSATKKAVIAGVVAGLIAGGVAGAGGYLIADSTSGNSVASGQGQFNPADPKNLSPRADNSIAAIAKKMLPQVVSIQVRSGDSGGTGSGFVIRPDGYLMTNNHVVRAGGQGTPEVTVQFNDGSTSPAKIVGTSPAYDIAILKVSKEGLPAATLGNSDQVVVGDAAVAIGSPLGLDGTVTSGIISSLRRPVTTGGQGEASFISALQTDAAINPGNSGGPLVNSESQVIGVTSAIATLGSAQGGESGSIGLGFAIPINIAKRIGDEIIATGKAVVPIVGVQINLEYPGPGAEVKSSVSGGPAASQGIKAGDVIVAVNGQQIDNATDLLSSIRTFSPGETITLTVASPGGSTKDVKVKLDGKNG